MGHEVELLAQHPSLTNYYLVKSGLHIDKCNYLPLAEKKVKLKFQRDQIKPSPWILWREIEKQTFELVCQQIAFQDYDIIHTQDIISTFVCKRTKPNHIPLVATIHGCLATEWIASKEIGVRSIQEQQYLSAEEYYGSMSADYLILPSRWLLNNLLAFQVQHPRSYVIQYGLNQYDFDRISGTSNFNSMNTTIIACPARLVAIKGQSYLIEAMRMLVDIRKDVVCWLIGDGVMRNDLEQQVNQLGLNEHIEFMGNRQDVPRLISNADIVVLPSLQDNLPFSIIESQSLGKPVIASRVGGIVEMIEEGVNGQLVEPGNARDLFEKLLLLVENTELRKEQSKEAKKHAQKIWNQSMMMDQTIEIYQKSMKDGSYSSLWDQNYSSNLRGVFKNLTSGNNQETGSVTTLKGSITELNMKDVVQNARVHLIDISGVVLRSTRSDDNGEFEFQDVQPGNYELGWNRDGANGMIIKKIAVDVVPITVQLTV